MPGSGRCCCSQRRTARRRCTTTAGSRCPWAITSAFSSTTRACLTGSTDITWSTGSIPRARLSPWTDCAMGMYRPMRVGGLPFLGDIAELRTNPPHQSPYFSVMLDDEGRWIDHHRFAIDGPVLHRDARNPDLLHVYLLSYERHTLINH